MPTDDSKTEKLFIGNGDDQKEFSKIEPISIDSEDVRTPQRFNDSNNKEMEFEAKIDKKESVELFKKMIQIDAGRVELEASCVCDGTYIFAVWLMQALQRMGATNIKFHSEIVENPDPFWMSCRFIATGIVWNTNNFRRMHGIPMKRRKLLLISARL